MKRSVDIYLVSFLQGGTIMGYELLVPKIIAPFFGGSIYVWACSLVFSMLGLAMGYYFSGRIVKNEHQEKEIIITSRNILLLAAVMLLLIVQLSGHINEALLSVPLKAGIITSSFIILTPVYFLLGMVSPLLIRILIMSSGDLSGKPAGNIFACSTAAGIVYSIVAGFYLIPELGLLITSIVLGASLMIAASVLVVRHRTVLQEKVNA
jgi:hypothetical protein